MHRHFSFLFFIVLFSYWTCVLSFSSNNSGLLEESSLQRKSQSQHAIELEFSPRTPSLLSLNSGTKWRDKTRLEESKERSSQWVKSSRKKPLPSKITESWLDILQELITSTCTRNTELLPFAKLSPCSTVRWPVDTVPEEIPSTSLKLQSSQTDKFWELPPPNTSRETSDSQSWLKVRELQPLPTVESSRLPDQPLSERDSDQSENCFNIAID